MEERLLLELALILVFTKSFGLLSRKIHLPQVVGALVAGVVLGPALLGIVHQSDVIEGLAEIGVILLMFSAGLETDLKQLRESLKSSVIIAAAGVLVPIAGGFLLCRAFGLETMEALFIGIVLTATSISITVEVLQELNKLKTKAGTAILGAAVIDDILVVIILSVMLGISGSGGSGGSISDISVLLIKIVAFFAVAWVLGSGMFQIIEYIDKNHKRARRLSIYSLSFCFLLAYLAAGFGIADITGAFFAGLSLCSSKAERYVEERSTILSSHFFSPVFFVSVGLYATFDGLNADILLFAALLLLVSILTKLVGCGLGALFCRFKKNECLQIGAAMVSRGEVAIIVATKGLVAGAIGAAYFSSLIIIVLITTLITPLLLKAAFAEKPLGAG